MEGGRATRAEAEVLVSDGTTDELILTQDLAARICHDLGGPVGMVAGLLDLLDEPDAEALASAREGAAELRRRRRIRTARRATVRSNRARPVRSP